MIQIQSNFRSQFTLSHFLQKTTVNAKHQHQNPTSSKRHFYFHFPSGQFHRWGLEMRWFHTELPQRSSTGGA